MYYPIFYPIIVDKAPSDVPVPEVVVYILVGGIVAALIAIAVLIWLETR